MAAAASDVTAQDMKARLDKHIRQIVDAAPPLTVEQRDRLALLLRGAGVSS